MAPYARAHTFPGLALMLLIAIPAAAIETNSINCNPSCINSSIENHSNGSDDNNLSEPLRSLSQNNGNDDKLKSSFTSSNPASYPSLQSNNESETSAKLTAKLKQDDNERNHGAFYGTPSSSIPETETYAMMLAGLGMLALRARRQKIIPLESD